MRALVVANGDPPSAGLARDLASQAGLVVAADGGVDKALALGLVVDAVVGDLDSASDAARAIVAPDRFHHAGSPDSTDLEKSIDYAIQAGATVVDVIGAGGGRADHALANLSVLTLFRGRVELAIHDDLFEIRLVEDELIVDGPVGTVVSLVAIGPCAGVTTSGLRWNLDDRDLPFSPLGVHNEVATPPARVSVKSGDLLLFRGRWVERHK